MIFLNYFLFALFLVNKNNWTETHYRNIVYLCSLNHKSSHLHCDGDLVLTSKSVRTKRMSDPKVTTNGKENWNRHHLCR